MLQNIRKNIQGLAAKIVVGLIVLTFALFGVESILAPGGVPSIAEVNGEPINANELQQQINLQKRRLMMSMGQDIDPSLLDDQIMAGPALDYLVQKMLLLQSAANYGMAVSEQRITDLIVTMPAFQIEGQFDPQRFRALLSDQGYTPTGFKQALREDLLMTQLRSGVSGAEFTTPQELATMAILREEQRDIRYLTVPIERFKDAATVSEEEIISWYEGHSDRYQTTENVDLEYIELRVEDFHAPVEESEVRELFELEKDNLIVAEVREISHILFEQGDDETDEALRTRISSVREQVAVDASNFATLAGEHSQDLGSANFGGELGLTSGDSFPPEIEEAVAALALNSVSEPVESDAGWHLLLVTDIRSGDAPSFDEMRMELQTQLRDERAQRDLLKASESLRDLVFNAEDLNGPAAKLDLQVAKISGINRSGNSGAFADARVISAAFSDELLAEGYNSEVLELGAGHFIVIRVAEHHPAALKVLAAVRSDVIDEILESQARAKAAAHADGLLAQLQSGTSVETLAHAEDYEWQVELGARRDNRNMPAATLARAFELQVGSNPSVYDYVQTPEGDVEVFEVFRVNAGNVEKMNEQRRSQLGLGMADQTARAVDGAFQKTLTDNAEVVRS